MISAPGPAVPKTATEYDTLAGDCMENIFDVFIKIGIKQESKCISISNNSHIQNSM